MTIHDEGKDYEVFLYDNGTLDTVITVNGEECIFSQEYAAGFRDPVGALTEDGFMELAYEAIDAYEINKT